MPLQHRHAAPRHGIPNPHAVILGTGDDARAVRREGDRGNRVRMPLQHRHAARRLGVPNAHAAIVGPGDDARAVRRDGDRGDSKGVAIQQLRHRAPVGRQHQHLPKRPRHRQQIARIPDHTPRHFQPGSPGTAEPGARQIGIAQRRTAQRGIDEAGIGRTRADQFDLHQAGAGKIGTGQIQVRQSGKAQICASEIRAAQIEPLIRRAAQHDPFELRALQLGAGQARGEILLAARQCGVAQRKFAGLRPVSIEHGLQRGLRRCVPTDHLAEEIQGFLAWRRQRPIVGAGVAQGAVQKGRQEKFLHRCMGKAEPILAFAHQKGGGAQILLHQIAADAIIMRRDARIIRHEVDQPSFQRIDAPTACAITMQAGGDAFHQHLLVGWRQRVLAAVAFQPGQH